MGKDTSIEWTTHSWNPWFGCTEVSPACDLCYARVMMDERYGKVKWGAGQPRVRTSSKNWNEPLRWQRAAAAAGKIETVFCLSLGDIWDNEVPEEWRFEALDVMRRCHNLVFLLLSKRIGNAVKMATGINGFGVVRSGLPSNCALGATMINQEEWDRDLPKLLHAGETLGAKFTFASVEPMLGPIEIMLNTAQWPDWVIVGGESGPHARPMHPKWPRRLEQVLGVVGVPFFFKQWGEWRPAEKGEAYDTSVGLFSEASKRARLVSFVDGTVHCYRETAGDKPAIMIRSGKKAAGRLLDGVEHNAKPACLGRAG